MTPLLSGGQRPWPEQAVLLGDQHEPGNFWVAPLATFWWSSPAIIFGQGLRSVFARLARQFSRVVPNRDTFAKTDFDLFPGKRFLRSARQLFGRKSCQDQVAILPFEAGNSSLRGLAIPGVMPGGTERSSMHLLVEAHPGVYSMAIAAMRL